MEKFSTYIPVLFRIFRIILTIQTLIFIKYKSSYLISKISDGTFYDFYGTTVFYSPLAEIFVLDLNSTRWIRLNSIFPKDYSGPTCFILGWVFIELMTIFGYIIAAEQNREFFNHINLTIFTKDRFFWYL